LKKQTHIFQYIGPGIITAALIFGPGSLIITSKLGSSFEYNLLWILILSTAFMILFTTMSARFGLVSGQSMLESIRIRYGKWISQLIGACILLVTVSFQTGNAIGAGLALAGLTGMGTSAWILLISSLAILLLLVRSFYRILEKIMILMVLIMILSFITTLVISGPDLVKILHGFIPRIPSGSEMLSIALIASSFSIVGAFFQSYLVQEKNWKIKDKKICIRESFSGIIILGMISMIVMMTSGSVLYSTHTEVRTAADMGEVLEPLFGPLAYIIFMTGLFAASFSSLIGNATLGGTLFADAISMEYKMHTRPVRMLIMIIIMTGAIIAVIFRKFGIQLIIAAQGMTILLAPFIGTIILMLTSNKEIMGNLKNSSSFKIIGITGLFLLLFLSLVYLFLMFS
jgi:Mn2+/Fe2+ NRAMP family transporter